MSTPPARAASVASWQAPDNQADLVRAAQAGDREAYGRLYERFARTVQAVLLARLPRTQVDDLVQDVFLHAMTKIADLRDPAAFRGWICTLARRQAIDHYRSQPAETPLVERAASAASPEVAAEAAAAVAAIQELPEAYRETLALRLVGGLSGPEIAAATGLTPESVRVNLHRGFRLLRSRLGVRS
ncbi:MAG TPA: sigma-70 family RNA polymerase sigma factor [Vicinamibacterales bacterium]